MMLYRDIRAFDKKGGSRKQGERYTFRILLVGGQSPQSPPNIMNDVVVMEHVYGQTWRH